MGNRKVDWLGIVDDKLELVRLQTLQQSTTGEHVSLAEVHPLSVHLHHFLESRGTQNSQHSAALFAQSAQPSLGALDELSLSEP